MALMNAPQAKFSLELHYQGRFWPKIAPQAKIFAKIAVPGNILSKNCAAGENFW